MTTDLFPRAAFQFQARFEAIHSAAKREKNGDPSLAGKNLRILTHAD
jgi:hypothetical protein